ncbi:MAG: hypothetical protein ACLUD2_07440 [Clostridium sp.]
MLLHQPVAALAATASTIEAGSGAVAETKPASVYGTTKVIDSEETETVRANWVKEGNDWYYLPPDGSRNRQDLQFDNALYKFNWNGSLKTAQWVPNTGGGAYPVFCYDEETQFLFDQLNDEKRDLYFEEYPDREEDYSGDEKTQYDRYAGFLMDEKLNQAAAYRLEAALVNGYSGDAIPGEGTLKDYLGKISYRKIPAAGSFTCGGGRMRMTPLTGSSARPRTNTIPAENGKIPWIITDVSAWPMQRKTENTILW